MRPAAAGAASGPPAPLAAPGGERPLAERLTVGRPTHFPSVAGWLKAGIFRNLRGVVAAGIAAWFYLPAAVLSAVVGALGLGILWLLIGWFGGSSADEYDLSGWLENVPVLGDAVANMMNQSGGVLQVMFGVIAGAVLGFVGGFVLLFARPFEHGAVQGLSTILGAIVAGVVVGLVYTAYRVVCEGWLLKITGARRLSRREAEFLLPIMRECAQLLGLENHPPVLIDDTHEPNALAYTRHIVINRGLLEEFNYEREPIAGILCHELVHWRNGDPISAAFVRGVALPLYLVQAGAGWLLHRATGQVTRFLIWFAFWPVFVTVRYFVVPLQAADSRAAEYRADQGAARAGHRSGMRRVLVRFRRSFEGGRNGWLAAVCAAHPPNELRLERLEEPGGSYRLPDDDAPPMPLPVTLSGSRSQD